MAEDLALASTLAEAVQAPCIRIPVPALPFQVQRLEEVVECMAESRVLCTRSYPLPIWRRILALDDGMRLHARLSEEWLEASMRRNGVRPEAGATVL